ncbi:MAG: DUF3040 domain-containing protein [Actinobacteria bacterium]|nr:DUF3040 domain-containing protein [Actinomycetota bacterium]
MALSEKEQALLAQMEAALSAEDPKLASTLRGRTPNAVHRRRAALAAIGFIAGVAILIIGMSLTWVMSVIGFVVMLVSTVSALTWWSRANSSRKPRSGDGQDFLHRIEEQWRRNEDGTD